MKSHSLAPSDFAGVVAGRLNALVALDDAAALILAGAPLAIAGRKEALDQLPAGNWIGGTTPYFLTADGGEMVDATRVFVTDFSGLGTVAARHYDADSLQDITQDAPEHGFSLAILPFQSQAHQRFAKEAGQYPLAFLKPTVGWIAGFDLGEDGTAAYVYDGSGGGALSDGAAVLQIAVPEGMMPIVDIVNIFSSDGVDTLRFEEASFSPSDVIVNGQKRLFADYIRERGLEGGQLPLVGDYSGARINASLRSVEAAGVDLYAPVFPGIDYAFAAPVADYPSAFAEQFAAHEHEGAIWSCNCILNYLFGGLEGKTVGGVAGPVTFGEIAYQLVNQTLVQVRVI